MYNSFIAETESGFREQRRILLQDATFENAGWGTRGHQRGGGLRRRPVQEDTQDQEPESRQSSDVERY